MQIFYKSILYKVFSVFRYFLARVILWDKFRVRRVSMIGRRCGIIAKGKGTIYCKGRMIINDDVMLFSIGQLSIGENFGINSYSRIVAHEKIEIGNNVTIGQMVSILDHDHNFHTKNGNLKLEGYNTSPIQIGNNVWIADKCTILKGTTIGNNVVIGANSLVNKDIPDNSLALGNPVRVIKSL